MMKQRQILIVGVLSLGLCLALLVGLSARWGSLARAQADGVAAQGAVTPQDALAPEAPMGTAFTYQGRLEDNGSPVSGPCDFRFVLYDSLVGGSQVGPLQERTDVELSDGRFAVNLDFGASAFRGQARWLEVAVQCASDISYATLGRVALTAAPQAVYALDADQLNGQQASAFASASHDHLGQTWTGSDNPLKIGGSFDQPGWAPLVLSNTQQYGNGLKVDRVEWIGVVVESAGYHGVYVDKAGGDGVLVSSAGDNGVMVISAGNPSSHNLSMAHDGLEVMGAEGHGLHVGRADLNGVHVESAGGSGLRVNGANVNGVELWDTTYDGVQINNAGRDGVRTDAVGIGVRADTQDASHEWGVYTPDKIYGSNVTSAGPLTFVAQNGDAGKLEPGDVVAGIGVTKPFAHGTDPIPVVGRADARNGAGVIGVVLSRFVVEEDEEEIKTEGGVERRTYFHTHSTDGPVAPGDHLLIVVLGVAQVKVEVGAEVRAGQRLTASALAGQARALRTETLNGMQVSEGAPVVGVALASPQPGETTIPVFVTLR
jgi:hypothetical protein